MEEYNNHQMSENRNTRNSSSFLYGSGPVLAPSSSGYARTSTNTTSGSNDPQNQLTMNGFYLQSAGDHSCYDHHQADAVGRNSAVKIEAGTSHNHAVPMLTGFPHPSLIRGHQTDNNSPREVDAIKAKIIAHPQYSNLLQAYMDCQKVGAPPEVVARLAAVRQEFEAKQRASAANIRDVSKDPELDQFMEAYYDMLVKYRDELTRPLQEAMEFMRRIESQLNILSTNNSPPVRIFNSPDVDKYEVLRSSEDEQENNSGGETSLPEIDPRAEDRELKNHLLKKYSGYLSSLKQELSKKKKKGKLPKEARQKLLSWWELHYKWPYPSESEKVALAEATGLDQKQINNWFINQRKRHWKPSEDMQFMVMDGLNPHNAAAALYMEAGGHHFMGEGPYRLGP